jgi:hypothetical protein
MIKSRYNALRISHPDYTIEECLDCLLMNGNIFLDECTGFYRSMRRWIEKAKMKEPFI